MKKLFSLLISMLLVPVCISAVQATADEKIYVLNNTNREAIPSQEIPTTCWFAYPFGGDVLSGERADLYSLQTQSAHGRVVNDNVKKVGELITCTVLPTGPSIPPEFYPLYNGLPENIAGVPSLNINIINSILLNGQQYYSTGSGRFKTNPVWGLPYPGFTLIGGTATVSKIVDGSIVIVGSYTVNAAIPWPGTTDNLEKAGGIIVLRISEPGFPVPN